MLNFIIGNALWLFVLAGLLFLATRLALKYGPTVHLLWVLVLVKALLPPLFSVPLPDFKGSEVTYIARPTPAESTTELEVVVPEQVMAEEMVAPELTVQPTLSPQPHDFTQIANEIRPTPATEETDFAEFAEFATQKDEVLPTEIQPTPTAEDAELAEFIELVEFAGYATPENEVLPTEKVEIAPVSHTSEPFVADEIRRDYAMMLILVLLEVALAGSFCCLVISVWRIRGFRKILRFSEPIDPELAEEFSRLAVRMGIRGKIEVRTLDANLPPLVWAFFRRPMVLISRSVIEKLDRDEILMLISHEFAHIKRCDHIVRYIELAATIVYWWHPMLWLARRELRASEELSCDAWTREMFPERNREYGHALLHTLDILSENQPPMRLPVTGSGMSMKETKRRIEMIVQSKIPHRASTLLKLFVALLAAIILPLSFAFESKEPQTLLLDQPEETEEIIVIVAETKSKADEIKAEEAAKEDVETFDLKVDCFDAEKPSEPVKDVTLILCKHIAHHKYRVYDPEYGGFETVKIEIIKVAEQKFEKSTIEFKDVPYPMDTRWFDQTTGAKLDAIPEGHEAIYETYFMAVKDGMAVPNDITIGVEHRFMPKKLDIKANETVKQEVVKDLPLFFKLRKVSGTILDESGRPIEGADVGIRSELSFFLNTASVPLENKTGIVLPMTQSDVQGRYQLTAPLYQIYRNQNDNSRSGYALQQVTLNVFHPDYNHNTRSLPSEDSKPLVYNITLVKNSRSSVSRGGPPATPRPMEKTPEKTSWNLSGKVVDEATKEPLAGVVVEYRKKKYNTDNGEAITVKTNEKGEYLFENIEQAENRSLARLTVLPFKRGGDTFVSNTIFPYSPPFIRSLGGSRPLVPEKMEHDFELVKGNLLIGKLMVAREGNKLLDAGNGKPFRIALNQPGSFVTGDDGRTHFNPLQITETDKEGVFRFYVPEGVCYPCILDNGDDVIWSRTENYEKWGKEGFLVQAGKINIVNFYVAPRVDSHNIGLDQPVEEERKYAEQLAMLPPNGVIYELDADKRITKVMLSVELDGNGNKTISKTLEILKNLKHLKTVDVRWLKNEVPKKELQRLLELKSLEEIIVDGPDGWPETKSLKGDEMKLYLHKTSKNRVTLWGVVRDPEGKPVDSGTVVHLYYIDPMPPNSPISTFTCQDIMTDHNGEFFHDPEPGKSLFIVLESNQGVAEPIRVEIGENERSGSRKIEVDLKRGTRLFGKVLDGADGNRPMAGIGTFSVMKADPQEPPFTPSYTPRPDKDGNYSMLLSPGKYIATVSFPEQKQDPETGVFTISAKSRNVKKQIEIVDGEEQELDLIFE